LKRLTNILLALLLTMSAVFAQTVKPDRIVFHGSRDFSNNELADFLNLPTGKAIITDSLAYYMRSLEDSLVTNDYLFARVDSYKVEIKGKKNLLHIYLNEGGLAKVANVFWHGDSLSVPKSVLSKILVLPERVFRWTNLSFDTKLLLDYFETNGYPFARVEIEKLDPDSSNQSIDIWMRIMTGPQTRLEYISFKGNNHSKSEFLLRETRLHTNELYDQRRVDAARRHLSRLEFIKRVGKEKIVVNDDGKTGLQYNVEEARSTRLDIVAGYQPASGNQSATFSGLVNAEFLNLFGVGRRGRVYWNRPDRHIQTVEVAYEEPWIAKQPVSLRLDFSQRIEDTLYVIRKYGLRTKTDISGAASIWGAVSREEVLVDSASEQASGLSDSKTTYLETGLTFDTRDHPTNPRSGVYFSTSASSGWRKRERSLGSAVAGSYHPRRWTIDSEADLEYLPFWIASLSVHGRFLESNEPEIQLPDLYRLGGARTLRGYREEQFLGSRIGWSSLELRYWLGPASRVHLFVDAGSAYREQLIEQSHISKTIFRTATGVGLRLETGIGIWGFDYGIGQEDKVLSGKIHVSLLSSF
jgi:outer membrane protein assembly factor BamA